MNKEDKEFWAKVRKDNVEYVRKQLEEQRKAGRFNDDAGRREAAEQLKSEGKREAANPKRYAQNLKGEGKNAKKHKTVKPKKKPWWKK